MPGLELIHVRQIGISVKVFLLLNVNANTLEKYPR